MVYIYIYANIGGILMVNVTIYGIHGSYGIYIPRPSKGSRFVTSIESYLRGHVSTPLSRTKQPPQDLVIVIVDSTILGEMLGGELNNKNFDFGKFRHANDSSDTLPTRIKRGAQKTPLSLKGCRFGTPCTFPPTRK